MRLSLQDMVIGHARFIVVTQSAFIDSTRLLHANTESCVCSCAPPECLITTLFLILDSSSLANSTGTHLVLNPLSFLIMLLVFLSHNINIILYLYNSLYHKH